MMSKKEALAQFHRDNIIDAAKELFSTKGIDGTSMDEIAARSEYSKSTIYVYFSGKDDIYYSIVYKYMLMLEMGISNCLKEFNKFEERYFAICNLMVEFADNEQMYFDSLLGKISVDESDFKKLPILKTIFDTGEEINLLIAQLFQGAIDNNLIDKTLSPIPTGFVFWSSICSLISVSSNKETYIINNFDMSKKEFLKFGFNLLLNSIRKKELI